MKKEQKVAQEIIDMLWHQAKEDCQADMLADWVFPIIRRKYNLIGDKSAEIDLSSGSGLCPDCLGAKTKMDDALNINDKGVCETCKGKGRL